jgi:DNA-binding CsgD family transcriptional regulator
VGIAATPDEVGAFLDSCAAAASYASLSLSGYLSGTDSLARSELAYFQGDLNRAEQFARRAVYQGRDQKQYEVETCGLFYLMRLNIPKGDIAGIREAERQLKTRMEKDEYITRYNIHDILMGRFYIRLGLIEKIAPWLRLEGEEGELDVLSRGFDTLAKVRCLIIEKNCPAALQILEEEQAGGDLGSFLFGFLEMTVLEAVTRHQLGDREGALGALKKAYDAGLPHGLVMPFIELGEYMHDLAGAVLKDHPDNPGNAANAAVNATANDTANAAANATAFAEISGIPRKWLQTIRRDASAYAKKRVLVAAQYENRETSVSADLSQYELSILNCLSQGRTSEEIAAVMHTPVKMVKSAIRQLYIKLGAANRADAVRNATGMGLLTDMDETD